MIRKSSGALLHRWNNKKSAAIRKKPENRKGIRLIDLMLIN
jgi:hypothetical protein